MLGEVQDRWNSLTGTHWWPVGNHNILKGIIAQRIKKGDVPSGRCIDIGCSGGVMAEYLSNYGEVVGTDISLEGLRVCRGTGVEAVNANSEQLPFKNDTFSAATLLDVAEHVENDEKLFKEISRVLKKEGILFVTVPAGMYLWGSHDVKYGHKRRYSKREFLKLNKKAGLSVERITYMHPYLLPVMAIARYFDRKKKEGYGQKDDFISYGTVMDKLLLDALNLEGWALQHINFFFGTSLLCILRKI